MNKVKIYLDDVRTPVDPTWKVVRNYEQFIDQVTYYGLENLDGSPVVDVVIHSANAVGSANMMGYINNYRHIHRLPQNCVRVQIEHTV
jgi:hypothetical protein